MNSRSLYYAVRVYIEQSPPERLGPLRVSNIAAKFKVNRSFLSRSFRKNYNCTLHQFLESEKMLRFFKLVAREEVPYFKNIMAKMNIKNPNHFIKKYKNRYGECTETPGQYCKRWRKIQKERRQERASRSPKK